MIKELSLIVIAVSALFFTGCGGGGSTSTPAVTAIVQIDNTTTFDVNELYIKKSESSSWGSNLVAFGEVIKSNSKVNFETSLCDTLIDIKFEYDFSLEYGIKEQIKLDCGDTYILKLVN